MGAMLILDRNRLERRFIAALAGGKYAPVLEASDASAVGRALLKQKKRPELMVFALDAKHQDALILLRWMHNAHSTIPVVVIAKGAARELEPKARALGARFFVYDPCDARELQTVMQQAVQSLSCEPAPASDVSQQNLSQLLRHLNANMKCPAGRDQVFLHSFFEFGQRPEPRVCLRCPIRADLGMPYYMDYRHIRDTCCGTPGQCDAMSNSPAEAVTGRKQS